MNNFSTPITQIKSRDQNIPWKTLIYSAVVLGITIIIYIGIRFGYKPFVEASIKNAEARIQEIDRQAPQQETQESFIQFYSQLVNIKNLLSDHSAVTPLFYILEENTMENIGFESMIINVADGTVSMSGFAGSYEVLAGQLAVYENIKGIYRASLSSARRANELIQFDLRLSVSQDLLTLAPKTILLENQPEIEETIEYPIIQ